MANQVPPVPAVQEQARRPTLEVDEKTSLEARKAVRRLVEELQAGWDRHDAETTNRHFAEDIVWGSPFGATVRGYASLHDIHTKLKAKGVGGRASHFEVESVLVPTPDVAIAQIRRKSFTAPSESATAATDQAKGFSEMALYVLVRRGDDWWVAAGQNTPIKSDSYAPKHDE
ncbi:MAG TPA: SgcJ/EcaC family oxidoreductase [Polyangiaceae bacterium]|nr:SgcJ/EcaC family oxidoreductase [Polyangiaceae bacterium]